MRTMKRLEICVVAAVAVSLAACDFVGGEGLDAKLDASAGYDVNYQASLSTAILKMTREQVELYTWAVTDLTIGFFISHYGKHPTARQVISGELDRLAQNNKNLLAKQTEILANMAVEVAKRQQLQTKARDLIGHLVATGEVVVSKRVTKDCHGIVCSDEETTQTFINYVVEDPDKLHLGSVPCSAVLAPKGKVDIVSYDLADCQIAGRHQLEITPPRGVSLAGAVVGIVFDYDKAWTADQYSYQYSIPEDLPEVAQAKEYEANLKGIAERRALLNKS